MWGDGTLVSGLSDISSGKTYYIAALNSSKYYTVPNTTISGQTFTCTQGTYNSTTQTLTTPNTAGEFVFTAVDGKTNAYYIYNTNLEKYLVATGSKTFGYVTSSSSDYGYWTFSTVAGGGFSGAFSVKHSDKTHYLRAYSNQVKCYDNATNQGVYLFEKSTPCATPTFSPVAGEVTKNTVVTVSSTTTGSTIYYTTNGDTPTTSSAHGTAGEASAEVTISSDMTVKAIAVKDGFGNSAVASASYTTAKAANTITVTGGTTQNIALTGGSAIEGGMYDLSDIVSATHGTVQYTIKETTNLTENTDFEFADGLFEFTNTYKGIIVVTASVPADEDYYAVEQDITINCSGDLRTPSYSFSDTEELAKESTITVANGTNLMSDGAITLSTTNAEVASVNNTTKVITGEAVGSCSITVVTAEGTYYASGSKTFTLNVIAVKGSAENPYTVAEAIAATPASGTSDDVYIKGFVSSFYSTNTNVRSDSYKRYYISDDGTTSGQLLVFNGKGYNNVAFTESNDLEIGDAITIVGGLTTYSSTKEIAANNYITSFFRKTDSDLTLTSSTPVALEMTSSTPHPTSTITWTTSSEGAMTFTSSDGSVATVSAAGVITAVGAGSATITFSQAADEAYKASTEKTVIVNVTDNRSACATGIDLSSAKTIVKGGSAAISATSTKADGFTGSITYSYVSANSSVFSITEGNYSGAGVGATTVTVTATPTGGNADNYKAASQEVVVTVNGTNSISLDLTSKSVAYGAAAFDISATVPTENYDGTVSAESSNDAVATVSVDGTTVTVTPVAVGSATITVTAGTDTYYPATASETCVVTVTAPEGETTFSSEVTVFEETFDKITKNASNVTTQGGNSNGQVSGNDQWSGSAGATDWSTASTKLDNAGWSADRGGGGYQCAKFGASSNKGYAITPALGEAGNFTLTFKAGAWSGDKTTDGLVLSIEAGTGTLGTSTFTLKDGEWDTYETTITGASTTTKIKFSAAQSSKNRFFLDEVKVTKTVPSTSTVTLNKYGYATYCSVNPIDCSALTGCTAWRVSDIDGTTITFTKITEKIKGGQGILLYNKDADGVNTSEATITFADGSTAFTAAENNLVGTTAPQYVTAGQYYGLKGNAFVPVNAGTVPAGKALLPAGAIPASARELTFVFEGDETTGVKTIDNGQFSIDNEAVYDLQGRKVTKPVKGGLYIVNGKKVIK